MWAEWVRVSGHGERAGPSSLGGTYCGEEGGAERGSHLQMLGRSLDSESGDRCWGALGLLPSDAFAVRDWIPLFLEQLRKAQTGPDLEAHACPSALSEEQAQPRESFYESMGLEEGLCHTLIPTPNSRHR